MTSKKVISYNNQESDNTFLAEFSGRLKETIPKLDLHLNRLQNPRAVLNDIKKYIDQLTETGTIISSAKDEERRNRFTRLQAIVEYVTQYYNQSLIIIHTPIPSSPLRLDPNAKSTHPTVTLRTEIIVNKLKNKPNVTIINIYHKLAPKEKQTRFQEILKKSKNIIESRTLSNIFEDPKNIGATIYIKNKTGKIIEFTVRQTQANDPQDRKSKLELRITKQINEDLREVLKVTNPSTQTLIKNFFAD